MKPALQNKRGIDDKVKILVCYFIRNRTGFQLLGIIGKVLIYNGIHIGFAGKDLRVEISGIFLIVYLVQTIFFLHLR